MTTRASAFTGHKDGIPNAIRTVMTTQAARYYHISTWALALWAVTSLPIALVWCAVTMGVASLRTLAEGRMRQAADAAATERMVAIYPLLATAVGMFWAIAPVLAWFFDHPYGKVASVAMLMAGYFMVVTQFRDSPRNAMLVSAPYTLVLLVFVAHGLFGANAWQILALLPVMLSAVMFVIVFNVAFSRQLARAQSKQEEAFRAAADARESELVAVHARQRAEDANTAKSDFLATMSHELRTPLNAIIGYSEIMRETAEEDGRAHDLEDHDRVLSAAKRLLYLINDVLDLSKIEAGRIELELCETDVAAIVRETGDAVRPNAVANGNTLKIDVAPDMPTAFTDGFRLGQCLLNLASNAAKFTKNGTVTIRASHAAGNLIFDVIDTGVGIAPEALANLFQPFVQADASTTRAFGGTGLGLVITRRIAQLLGGDVGVVSSRGEGSIFTLRVPIRSRAEDSEAPPADAAPAPAEPSVYTAIAIDDDAATRDLVARALSRAGFEVGGAANAASGLELASAHDPRLIILDMNLPDGHGLTVLESLQASHPHVPVVVVSVDDDRGASLRAGACAHLVKPIDRDELTAVALRFARPASGIQPLLTESGGPTKSAAA